MTSKYGVLANVAVWNATTGLLHQLHGAFIQRPGDLETKEPLHLAELQAERADPPSHRWTTFFSQVVKPSEVALQRQKVFVMKTCTSFTFVHILYIYTQA